MEQDPQGVGFLGQNIVLIGIVVLVIFGYFVMLIRKRWKQNFLHSKSKERDG
jgi:hypothetical protein